MANVLGFMSKIAPWVTAAATGNVPALIGLAAKTVGDVTGKKVDSTADSISAAIAGATPEQILALKQADAELQVKLQALGFQDVEALAKISADDRANARLREETLKDKIPSALAIMVTLGFFGVLAYMLKYQVPAQGHDAMLLMLGGLGSAWTSVVAYYFGSSAGSAAKTELLAHAPAIQK